MPQAFPALVAWMLREVADVCSTYGYCAANIRIMPLMNVCHYLAEKHPSTLALASGIYSQMFPEYLSK